MKSAVRWLWIVVLGLIAVVFAAPARADGARGGRILVSLPGGGRGPLVLGPGQGGWVGALTVTNLGAEPLVVSRVAIQGSEDDVRSPEHLGARFVDGSPTSATLLPGASKDVQVTWMPDKDSRVHQAFGQVVMTSTDEAAGEVAIGFRAQTPSALGWVDAHALSMLVMLPLVVAVVAAGARLAGRRDDPLVAQTALAIATVELGLALWSFARFVPDLGRAHGNDGFQLVERAVWIRSLGAEWYLGVDGVSVAMVPLAAGLWLVAMVVAPAERRGDGYLSALALLASSTLASFVALDLSVLFAAWQLVMVALVMLVGGWGGPRGEHAAAKLAAYAAVCSGAMLAAFVALSRASGRAFLVDGTTVAHTLSIPELARTSFASRGPILGLPFVDVVWVLLFLAVAVVTPVVPAHGWIVEVLVEAPSGAALMLAGLVTSVGPYLLVRVGLGAMPEGARWAGASIAVLGVVSAAYGGLCAMAQRDLRRFVAYVSIGGAGATLFAIASFTTQGLEGAVGGMFARGLGAALLVGTVAMLERRLRTSALAQLSGLTSEAPAMAAVLALGLAGSLGVPCLVGFWPPFLALLGGFARHPVLAVLLALAIVASAAAHLRVARLVLLGTFDVAWRRSLALKPFRGGLPDATPRELAALVPVAVVALLLGLWPTPLLSATAAGARDAAAAVEPPATP